jgi:hypothetical protein
MQTQAATAPGAAGGGSAGGSGGSSGTHRWGRQRGGAQRCSANADDPRCLHLLQACSRVPRGLPCTHRIISRLQPQAHSRCGQGGAKGEGHTGEDQAAQHLRKLLTRPGQPCPSAYALMLSSGTGSCRNPPLAHLPRTPLGLALAFGFRSPAWWARTRCCTVPAHIPGRCRCCRAHPQAGRCTHLHASGGSVWQSGKQAGGRSSAQKAQMESGCRVAAAVRQHLGAAAMPRQPPMADPATPAAAAVVAAAAAAAAAHLSRQSCRLLGRCRRKTSGPWAALFRGLGAGTCGRHSAGWWPGN